MPYWDDWGFASFLQDYQNGKLTFADFLVPINEHRMFFNRLISVAVFELNHQQWDPVVMMLINAGIWTLSGVLLLYITIKHQRQFNALPLILIILMICLYPVSPVNALWGVQTHNYMMILLAVSACWFINQPVLSAQWWLGLSF